MADSSDLLDVFGKIAKALRALGLEPVLVGGMALVMLGSRRVTRGFAFVVAEPGDQLKRMTDVFYDRDLELASRLNRDGDVTATTSNRRVASIRLRLDAPASARGGLVADLLLAKAAQNDSRPGSPNSGRPPSLRPGRRGGEDLDRHLERVLRV